jgi:hypothetical protein
MLNLSYHILHQVADKALLDAAAHPRWVVAIGRALVELEQNPWIERADHGLIIGSTSGKCYAANGVCQCQAYTYGQACWHRAAARLVRLHDEALERDEAAQRASVARLVLEAEAIIAAGHAGLITMPEGDTLDTDGMRVARKIASARCAAQFNSEMFA